MSVRQYVSALAVSQAGSHDLQSCSSLTDLHSEAEQRQHRDISQIRISGMILGSDSSVLLWLPWSTCARWWQTGSGQIKGAADIKIAHLIAEGCHPHVLRVVGNICDVDQLRVADSRKAGF